MYLMARLKTVAVESFSATAFLPSRDNSCAHPDLFCVEFCVVAWNAFPHPATLTMHVLGVLSKYGAPHYLIVLALPRQVTRPIGRR